MEHDFRRDYEQLSETAELLKVIAHPVRLCILRGLLEQGPCNVTKIQGCLDLPQSTVSQHLGRLRTAGLIVGDRNGTEITYRVKNERLAQLVRELVNSH
jgi:ArsR family transcriptional regulator